MESGSNEENNRALVRAMALDENYQDFVDLQNDTEKAMPSAISEADTREVDIDTNENSPDGVSEEIYEEASEEDQKLGASQDGRDLKAIEASIEASKAKTQAIYAEIARLKTETAKAYEQAKQKKTEARDWAIKSERLKMNSSGGIAHRQISPAGLHLDMPKEWLEDAPQPCDKNLADEIKRITSNYITPRYWLRGFDPFHFEGLVAYRNLRTAFKRLSLNMYTDPIPKCNQIREVISAIRWRTTSWLSDEAVCFAILLGIDVGKVQEGQGQDRIKILASMWQEVPSELAFCPLKRIEDDGFKWMPQSFLGTGLGSTASRGPGTKEAFRSQRGICLKTEGITFDLTSPIPKGQSLAFRMDESWYKVWPNIEDSERGWEDVETGLTAILCEEDVRQRPFQRSITGAVAKVVEEARDTIYLSHMFAVRITLVDQLDDLMLVHDPWVAARDQEWCIG